VELTAEHNSVANSNANPVTLAFCGIGNPDGFRKTLKAAEVSIHELVGFPDHHHYDQSDIQKLTATAEKLKAKALITTLKDLVKIEPGWVSSVGVVALSIEAQVTSGKESLATAISKLTPPPNR
jgi:tetraacyldisaccharide 4'-kinase